MLVVTLIAQRYAVVYTVVALCLLLGVIAISIPRPRKKNVIEEDKKG